MKIPTVNGDRLWNNVLELGSIGNDGRGVSRVAFSKADMAGRRWLLDKMNKAGLDAYIDQAGNVFGKVPLSEKKKVLIGSHLDTVPEGGMFDGALGVLAALECAQTIIEQEITLPYEIHVAAFSNEEGSEVGPGLYGSRYFAEGISENEAEMMKPFLEKAGLKIIDKNRNDKRFNPGDYLCYIELHIEQGGVLDNARQDIGVVQGIVGIHTFEVIFKGVSNHAGTTPMKQRQDALLGAASFVLSVPEVVSRDGSDITVATCGHIEVLPGARNVIPGQVSVSVEVRDLDEPIIDRVVKVLKQRACEAARQKGLAVEISPVLKAPSAKMDDQIQAIITKSAGKLGLNTRPMPSGAGHDAAVFAKYVPTAMIFVASKNGISHSPDEWTERQDCVNGTNVLLNTLLSLAR